MLLFFSLCVIVSLFEGIGPADHLKEMKIKVVSDLPVGNNLIDTVGTALTFTLNSSASVDFKRDMSPKSILNYFADKNNSLTSSLFEAVAYVKTKYANQSDDWPDIVFQVMPGMLIINLSRKLSIKC